MKRLTAGATAILATILCFAAHTRAQSNAEAQVLAYIREHVRAGQPIEVSRLYSQVFTTRPERQALDKLYQAFFRIPLFIAEYQTKFGKPPALQVIAQQFALGNPEAADVLLRVMESDPRVPWFIARDPETGEITKVDSAAIESDPRFNRDSSHRLGGWIGQPAPAFDLQLLGGGQLHSAGLGGKAFLLYIWFTGCPPCMKEAPALEDLERAFSPKGFEVIGANADGVLHLGYDNLVRRRYVRDEKLSFPVADWSAAADQAYGNVTIFPTLFLVGRNGLVLAHWVGFTEASELRTSIEKALSN